MTLSESGHSTAEVSLAGLLRGGATRAAPRELNLEALIDLVARGGWPAYRDLPLVDARRAVRDYLEQIRRTDVSALDGTRRDPGRIGATLMSFARHIGTPAPLTQIADDVSGGTRVSDDTVGEYIRALERLSVVEHVPAWNVHLRSRRTLRTTPVRQFVDPSLAVAALGAGPAELRADLNYFGFLFESLAIRDLRVYAQPLDGEVFFYRDSDGREIDAIVDAGAAWGAFEIKLGARQVDEAAKRLLKIVEDIDTSRRGEPSVLGVITGGGFGYVRPDGVHVIPLDSLAP